MTGASSRAKLTQSNAVMALAEAACEARRLKAAAAHMSEYSYHVAVGRDRAAYYYEDLARRAAAAGTLRQWLRQLPGMLNDDIQHAAGVADNYRELGLNEFGRAQAEGEIGYAGSILAMLGIGSQAVAA